MQGEYIHTQEDLFQQSHGYIILEYMIAYEMSRGNDPLYAPKIQMHIIHGLLVMMTIAELLIYVAFFHHVYRHDNGKGMLAILRPEVIRKRNRTNAITFLGQFFAFICKFVIFIMLVIAVGRKDIGDSNLFIVVLLIRSVGFALLSMVEVMTSDALRSKMLKC